MVWQRRASGPISGATAIEHDLRHNGIAMPRRALINYRAQNVRQAVTNTVVPNGGLRARLGCPVVAVSGPHETLGSGRRASGPALPPGGDMVIFARASEVLSL